MSGKKKTNITPSVVHWDDVLTKEFEDESDRACVILAAALLDTALRNLLLSKLTPSSTSNDTLFDGVNAPLSTFSARIEMCFRLGLLSPTFCRDLHLIRKIRNEFAHNISGCNFEESAVRDRVNALSNSSGCNKTHESWHERFPDTPKGQFQFVISWMQFHIRRLNENVESFKVREEEWGYKNDWGELDSTEDKSPS